MCIYTHTHTHIYIYIYIHKYVYTFVGELSQTSIEFLDFPRLSSTTESASFAEPKYHNATGAAKVVGEEVAQARWNRRSLVSTAFLKKVGLDWWFW